MIRDVFEGFVEHRVEVGDGVQLRVRHGGAGPAVVLLHGHPRTHTTWHVVPPLLVTAGHTVVCPDLRGYGQSSKPPTAADHSPYSKRVVAADVLHLMNHLGHERFAVVGHDRGSYVAMRLALDLEDYRAGLGPDRAADELDLAAGRRISCPTLVLWSTGDDLADLHGDVLAIWKPWTTDLSGGPIVSGHHMAEDAPQELAARLVAFLA